MKVKNYEKNELVIFIIIIIFLVELFFVLFLYKYKIYEYKTLTGIAHENNTITLIVTKEEKKMLNKNKKVYIDNKYNKFKIIEDKGYLMKKNNTKYYEILISVKNNKKSNEVVNISVKNKKIEIIRLLKKIWEGG